MKRLTFLLIVLSLSALAVSAQPYTDGPIELKVRVREIKTLFNPSDSSAGNSPDEFSYKIWIRDSPDLDGSGFVGGFCLSANLNPPAASPDFYEQVFHNIYTGDTVPRFFDIRLEAWEDDLPSDLTGGFCTSTSRCDYNGSTCCGVIVFGSCVGVVGTDDNHCVGDPFAVNIDYRRGPPGEWTDHGYISGSCGNTYLPRIESYWSYKKGASCNDAIDLGTLPNCALYHLNNNLPYGDNFSSSPGNDVFYQFTVSSTTSVTISLCNAASFDSYLYLLDSSCNITASNDDACGTQSSITQSLSAGTYYVVVDGKTASSIGVFTLSVRKNLSNPLTASINNTNPSCLQSNGSATVVPSGGFPDFLGQYYYYWNDTAHQTTKTATGLAAGFYSVTVTDFVGCHAIATTVLVDSGGLAATITSTDDTCGGIGEGSATVNVSGGGASYLYLWSEGSATATINNLSAGIYSVTVSDTNGCGASKQVTINEKAFISGAVRSETGAAIKAAVITGNAPVSLPPDTTGTNGDYSFELNTGSYCYVIPAKKNDSIPNNGITSVDLLQIRRHILNMLPLNSPYKIIAADVNHSGTVTSIDILYIRSLILGTNTSFPGGRLWAFVPDDFVFADSLNPFPYDTSRYLPIVCRETNQDFIGMKLGDVNNSWDPTVSKMGAVAEVLFSMDEYHVMPVDEIIVPVQVKGFNHITGYQFTLSWNPEVLLLLEVNNQSLNGYYGMHKTNEGYLATTWYDDDTKDITLNDDETVFELKFKVIGTIGSQSEIKIGSELTASEAYNDNLDLLDIVATNGMVKVGDVSSIIHPPSSIINLTVQPNPFSNSTNIIFTLPQDESVTLSIYDILGREVKHITADYKAGEHQVEWEGDDAKGIVLSKGLYHVRMVAGNNTVSRKVVMMK